MSNNEMNENRENADLSVELLKKLVDHSKKQLMFSRITTVTILVMTAAIVVCMVILIPPVMETVSQAKEVMAQASAAIERADEAVESVTEMSKSVTNMCNDMDILISENSETVSQAMKKMEAIDFEGLNKAIKDLGDVVEPFASFFGKFK